MSKSNDSTHFIKGAGSNKLLKTKTGQISEPTGILCPIDANAPTV